MLLLQQSESKQYRELPVSDASELRSIANHEHQEQLARTCTLQVDAQIKSYAACLTRNTRP
jgi:hypothetical protein